MSLAPGTRLGAYEVLALIGAGGMGEVYKARDTRLDRLVALKTSKTELDERFAREARVIATLNHPHICTLHDVGPNYFVMEYIDGTPLQGALPLDLALKYAGQIADALDAAHTHHITHRDLKPANILVTKAGVKLLDFGLAKQRDPVAVLQDPEGASQLETAARRPETLTADGTILGTLQYMAPEQLQGRDADARSDIFAFGLVLYEMLTGRRAFAGSSRASVIGAILERPAPIVEPEALHRGINRVIGTCLAKDPSDRFQTARDLKRALEWTAPGNEPAVLSPARKTRERQRWVAALVVTVAAAAAGMVWSMRRPQLAADEVRFEINAPPTTEPTSLAISPDGRQIVFVATSDGTSRLWVRPLDVVSARPLAGTDNAKYPFWSPDSRSVGFSADGQLKRVDLDSSSVRVVVSGSAEGGTWNRDGTILFDRGVGNGLFRVSADGGESTAVVTQSSWRAFDPWFPQFLPDQRHYLFYGTGTAPGIYIGQPGEPDAPRRILDAEAAAFASTGHLLFVRQGTLLAQAFDPVRLELAGSPTAVSEQIVVSPGEQSVALSVSAAGPIVYRTGPSGGQSHFVWFDRSGKALETVAGSDDANFASGSLSPDGRRLAFSRRVAGTNSDIWLLDVNRGVPSRFTFDPAPDAFPVWSPDGRRIAWGSTRNGKVDIYVKPADGTGTDTLLLGVHRGQGVSDWSPDGRFLLYQAAVTGPTGNNQDIWALPFGDDRQPFPVVESTTSDEINGQFSPDGQWIAYQSNETGRHEIYVQPFRGRGPKTAVSSGGGVQARWRHDGRELFYLAPGNRLMAVPIRLNAKGQSVEVDAPASLFVTRLPGDPLDILAHHYMVSRDGQRFLVNTLKEVTLPITVILNWKPKP